MYFFQNRESAEKRIGDPLWPSYFAADNLVEMELDAVGVPTIVDADWITVAPCVSDGRLNIQQLDWIESYWTGKPRTENPVWEVIAEGTAAILDSGIRKRCYDSTLKQFPDSETFMLMAQIGADLDTDGGLISPFLLGRPDGIIRLAYLLNDKIFHESEYIAKIKNHRDAGKLGQLMQNDWKAPDFRPWMRAFELGAQARKELAEMAIPSVHFSQPTIPKHSLDSR